MVTREWLHPSGLAPKTPPATSAFVAAPAMMLSTMVLDSPFRLSKETTYIALVTSLYQWAELWYSLLQICWVTDFFVSMRNVCECVHKRFDFSPGAQCESTMALL